MDNLSQILLCFFVITVSFFLFFKYISYSKESFQDLNDPVICDYCPRGYCKDDLIKEKDNTKSLITKYPANKNFYCLGYDNPYIYPYNYFMNLNHPTDRFKFPGWIRQIELDVTNYHGFPGYVY